MNIYQRVNEIRKRVHYAKKDKAVQGQGYKAVTHDAVTALLRNHLIEHGVVVVPRLSGSDITIIGETKSGTPMIRYAARYEIDFVNCDDPADKITVTSEAHANDHGDKAPGKATSYATKYAMLKLFAIETGEDDEGRAEPYMALAPITPEQAADLQAMVEEVGADRDKFLAYFKVDSLDGLPATKYAAAVAALNKKRSA
jgi:hypothetical protein